MKIKISYFYQLRFLKPYQIPVSTAVWDPKWFHDGKGQNHIFKDKNGVYNGIRIECLHPDFEAKCCKGCQDDPETCSFKIGYTQQLSGLDFSSVLSWLTQLADNIKNIEKFDEEPEIILMVYETPENQCSERKPLIDWFASNGINVEEFKREDS